MNPFWSNDPLLLYEQELTAQSFSPLQKRVLSMQVPSPQAKDPSAQRGSSVKIRGLTWKRNRTGPIRDLLGAESLISERMNKNYWARTFFSLDFLRQFFTWSFQSQVCFSMSKASPAGHLKVKRIELAFYIVKHQTWVTHMVHWTKGTTFTLHTLYSLRAVLEFERKIQWRA